jgi:branched-chain amino acid transport system permease protein
MTLITLAMLVVGGQRSLAGAVVGVAAVTTVVEIFRQLENGVTVGDIAFALPNGVQQLVLAVAMLLSLAFWPNGLMGGGEIPPPRWLRRPAAEPGGERAVPAK